MPYCTLNELISASSERDIIQLTDDSRSGVINESFVDDAIEKADGMISAYAGGRYTLPLPPVLLIRDIAVDIAMYRLYQRRHRDNMPDSVMASYKNAEKQLGLIQSGRIAVPGAALIGGDEMGSGEIRTNKTKDSRLFGWDKLDRY